MEPSPASISLLSFFSLLLLIARVTEGAPPPPSQDDQLLLVQAIIRHADRAPVREFTSKNASSIFYRGLGQLSNDGIDNAYTQGEAFRARYVDSGFVDRRFIPEQVYAQSSPVPRVLMSAAAFGAALFDRTTKDRPVPLPIHSVPYEDDMLLVPHMSCPDGWPQVAAKYNFTGSKAPSHVSEFKAIFNAVTKASGLKVKCAAYEDDMVEAAVAEIANSEIELEDELEECALKEGKQLLFKYMSLLSGAGDEYNVPRLRRMAGHLLSTLVDNMVKTISCQKNCTEPKMRIYFTHDIVIMALSQILGVLDAFNGVNPEFSSALVLELRQSRYGPYVSTILKNGHAARFIDVSTCSLERNCTLDTLISTSEEFFFPNPVKCSAFHQMASLGSVILLLLSWLLPAFLSSTSFY